MVAAAVVGAGVIGAVGSNIAAGQQASAANNATATQLQMYNQTRQDLLPFTQGGQSAFSSLQALLGLGPNGSAGMLDTLKNMPGYQFTMDQGVQALDRSAAARGEVLSGGQLKDVTAYGEGLAQTNYGNYVSQLQAASSLGESAASQTGNTGASLAQGAAQSQIAAGTAAASGTAGITNNLGSILTNQSVLAALNGGQTASPYGGMNLNNQAEDATLNSLSGANYIPASDLTLSDRRAKTDVQKIGKLDSGLPLYSYRLKGSARTQMGVMADQVRRVDPRAVRRGSDGLDRVDYKRVSQIAAAA